MNESQGRHLGQVLDKAGFERGYDLRGDELAMEVWIRKDAAKSDELHILTSMTGLFRVMLCRELGETDDGTNPNLDVVFRELEKLGAEVLPKKRQHHRRNPFNPGDRP